MTTLNAGAARAMSEVGVHAATDVTGFGLLGHLRTLLEASAAAAELRAAAVPLLGGARDAVERGAIPGGTQRNADNVADTVTFAPGVNATTREEALEGRLPMTGELLAFPLRELESFAVLP